jgi:hypothetical protein
MSCGRFELAGHLSEPKNLAATPFPYGVIRYTTSYNVRTPPPLKLRTRQWSDPEDADPGNCPADQGRNSFCLTYARPNLRKSLLAFQFLFLIKRFFLLQDGDHPISVFRFKRPAIKTAIIRPVAEKVSQRNPETPPPRFRIEMNVDIQITIFWIEVKNEQMLWAVTIAFKEVGFHCGVS